MITFIQVIFQILVLAYTMKLLKKLNTNYVVRIVILLLFSLLPIFNINSVGIYKDINGKLTGDVDFDFVSPSCGFITPVPGGVGPMTIASLMYNASKVYE